MPSRRDTKNRVLIVLDAFYNGSFIRSVSAYLGATFIIYDDLFSLAWLGGKFGSVAIKRHSLPQETIFRFYYWEK